MLRVGFAVLAVAFFTISFPSAYAGDGKTEQPPTKAPASQGLSGSDLYAINCNRCHEQRYPKEFTATQWTTLMLHMRVRANLTASDAKKILKYLQGQAGN